MEKKRHRDSNLELLRILAMLAIIGYHFYLQTPIYHAAPGSFNHFFAMVTGSFGRTSVNLFVMTGAWFLIDLPFRSMRIFRLYAECFFYTTVVTALVLFFCPLENFEAAYKMALRGVLPFSGSPLWFITDYLFLLILSPFLNALIRALEPRKYAFLTGILIVVFVVAPTLESLIPGFDVYEYYIVKSDMGWLITLYLIVGYLKKNPFRPLDSPRTIGLLSALLIGGCVALCAVDCFGRPWIPSAFLVRKFHAFLEYLFMDLSSVFCFALAVLVFFGFKRISLSSGWINRLSRNLLGIYILHQVPAFIPHVWNSFRVADWVNSPLFPVWECLTILGVFAAGWCADNLTGLILQPLLKSAPVARLSRKWDEICGG